MDELPAHVTSAFMSTELRIISTKPKEEEIKVGFESWFQNFDTNTYAYIMLCILFFSLWFVLSFVSEKYIPKYIPKYMNVCKKTKLKRSKANFLEAKNL